MKTFYSLALIAASVPAMAQSGPSAPLEVYYTDAPGRFGYLADQAVRAVLQRPGFIAADKPDAETLVVTVPDEVDNARKTAQFTLRFTRDGNPIGEAAESCNIAKLDACSDQVAADLTSASAVHPSGGAGPGRY